MKSILLTLLLVSTAGCVHIGKSCIGYGPSCAIDNFASHYYPEAGKLDQRPLSCMMYYDCSQMYTLRHPRKESKTISKQAESGG